MPGLDVIEAMVDHTLRTRFVRAPPSFASFFFVLFYITN
jgi:hypothetical protein